MSVKKNILKRSDCPLNYALEIFGDKWSLLIIRDMLLAGKISYGEFLASEEKISTNILAARLDKLEELAFIKKSRDPKNKTKFIYHLTKQAKDLLPLMLEMIAWSLKYDPDSKMPQKVLQKKPDHLGLSHQEKRKLTKMLKIKLGGAKSLV